MRDLFLLRSFLVLSFCLTHFMHASCVKDGMNLWRLTENVSCSVGAVCEIKQSDLTSVYFINNPGHYKLCENVTGPARITIRSSDVILDLGGYYAENMVIDINSNIQNIIIRNGTLKNTPVGVNINPNTHNILIEDLVIDTLVPNLVLPTSNFAFAISSGPVTGVTLRNISIYNGCPQNIIFSGFAPDYITDIVLENVSCIGTNSAFTAELQPNVGIIYLFACQNIVFKNVNLENQIAEVDGIVFDTCLNGSLDGGFIKSTLSAPSNLTFGYHFLNGTSYIDCNDLVVNCGANRVYQCGICLDLNTTFININRCSAAFADVEGIRVFGSNSILTNCLSEKSTASGFLISVGSNNQLYDCVSSFNGSNGFNCNGLNCIYNNCRASYNTTSGFLIAGQPSTFTQCYSSDNTQQGFRVFADGCSFNKCNAEYNQLNGFYIDVSNGCLLNNCTMNYNGSYGAIVNNVVAQSAFSLCNPFAITSAFVLTDWHGVYICNCTALGNALRPAIVMDGLVYDTTVVLPCPTSPQSFTQLIIPPIGILNTTNNAQAVPNWVALGTFIGTVATFGGFLAGAVNGNLVPE